MHKTLVFLTTSCLLAGAGAARAQGELELVPCSGGIGKNVDYRISGGTPFRPFLFFTSLMRGNFPLSLVDPKDSRSLGVGFDLLALLVLAQLDKDGQAAFSLQLPNDGSLAGKALLHQALSFPGIGTLFGSMSQVAVIPLEVPGAWRDYPQFTMTDKRAWISGIPLRDGRILAAGGGNGALLALVAVSTSEIWDPATRQFSKGPALTQPRGLHTTNELSDGRFVLAGGVNQNNDPQKTCEFYDTSAGKFVAAPAMSFPRMLHTATTLADGRVFVAGGLTNMNGTTLQQLQSATRTTEILSKDGKQWTRGPDMSAERAGHTAHLLGDGRVVLIAGITLKTILRLPDFWTSVEVFDPKTGKITPLAGSLNAKRAGQASTVLADGRLFVAGGIGGSILPNGGSALTSCEVYSFATKQWTAAASLRTARGLMSSLHLTGGGFAVLGGVNGSLTSPSAIADCDVYDAKQNRWTALPGLKTSRATHLAVELPSCALFVLGGGSGQTGSALNTQEILYR